VGLVVGAVPRPRQQRVEVGITATVSSWTRISDRAMPPRVKATANYVNNRQAEIEARRNGYEGALLMTAGGKVSEGSGACLFLLRGDTLLTPDVSSDILESITRDTIVQIASEDLGLKVIERQIDRSELYAADEMFLCGSGWEIVPVRSVDPLLVGSGEVGPRTRSIQKHYFDVATRAVPDHPEWRTPVYGGL